MDRTESASITAPATLIATVANIVANAILVPRAGALSAAIATATMMTGYIVALVVLARRVTGVDPTVLALVQPAKNRAS